MTFKEVHALLSEGYKLLTYQHHLNGADTPWLLKYKNGSCHRIGSEGVWNRDEIESSSSVDWAEDSWTLPVIYEGSEEDFMLEFGEQL